MESFRPLAFFCRPMAVVVGFLYPAYASYKALERGQMEEVAQWLTYWVVFSLFTVVEGVVDRIIYWLPFYYVAKLAFVLWLQLPQSRGASKLFKGAIKPLIKKHEAQIDRQLETGLERAMALQSRGVQLGSQLLSRGNRASQAQGPTP
mmetsp:Transcript_29398/g.82139  ORF Transcript_29398/g.82139 Transcript_29398/m.82139 type:complete len:148 (-) Transcript_29398:176-619(-)